MRSEHQNAMATYCRRRRKVTRRLRQTLETQWTSDGDVRVTPPEVSVKVGGSVGPPAGAMERVVVAAVTVAVRVTGAVDMTDVTTLRANSHPLGEPNLTKAWRWTIFRCGAGRWCCGAGQNRRLPADAVIH